MSCETLGVTLKVYSLNRYRPAATSYMNSRHDIEFIIIIITKSLCYTFSVLTYSLIVHYAWTRGHLHLLLISPYTADILGSKCAVSQTLLQTILLVS